MQNIINPFDMPSVTFDFQTTANEPIVFTFDPIPSSSISPSTIHVDQNEFIEPINTISGHHIEEPETISDD